MRTSLDTLVLSQREWLEPFETGLSHVCHKTETICWVEEKPSVPGVIWSTRFHNVTSPVTVKIMFSYQGTTCNFNSD